MPQREGLLGETVFPGLLGMTRLPGAYAAMYRRQREEQPQKLDVGINRLQALSLSQIPVAADIAGVAGDLQMYAQDPSTRTPLNYALTGLGALPFIPAMAGARVFHGTPHRFAPEPDNPLGAFRPEKIGTGEGAQAYGYGHYVAENPGTANTYMQTQRQNMRLTGGLSPTQEYISDLMDQGLSKDEIFGRATDAGRKFQHAKNQSPYDAFSAEYDALKRMDTGGVYQVDLPDEQIEKMLDWDKPLSEQPENVKAALKKAGIDIPRPVGTIRAEEAPLLQELVALENAGQQMTPRGAELRQHLDTLARELNRHVNPMTGEDLIRGRLRGAFVSSEGVVMRPEDALRAAGIPGIKFLDQGSRAAGEGTRNFVVFPGNEHLMKIVGRE